MGRNGGTYVCRELAIAKSKADVFDAHCADKGESLARFVGSLDEVRKRKIDRQRR